MRFWWVNHDGTWTHEISGEFLWSPKREKGDKFSQFYANMRVAAPGDLVIAVSKKQVRFVGRVTDFAFPAIKPREFGAAGSAWGIDGWLLPVSWFAVENPFRPKRYFDLLRPLLPKRHTPLTVKGDASQKAYLSEVSQELFDTVLRLAEFPELPAPPRAANSLHGEMLREVREDEIESLLKIDAALSDTVRKSVIEARRGQGLFRANVMKVCPACPLTGVSNPALLIASHIKPWRVCTTAEERLDGLNGLMLTPDADLLFDRGFIGFREAGEVMVSGRVDREDLRRLGLGHISLSPSGLQDAGALWREQNLQAAQAGYLAYHRENVFLGG